MPQTLNTIDSITPNTIILGESVTITYTAYFNSDKISDNGTVIHDCTYGTNSYTYTPTTIGEHSISISEGNSYTITVTATIESSINNLIDKMETNLQTMGVIDAEFDSATGLMGLADEILNVPTSSGGGGSHNYNSVNLVFTIHDNYFKTYTTQPLSFSGNITVDWGDGTTETYAPKNLGYLEHTYSTIDDHTITISGYITKLNDSCFRNCYTLKEVNIPSSVTNISNYCFYNCYTLKEVNIPSSVTNIGNYCFQYCYNLTNINIPSGVTSLGSYCFGQCYNLRSVNMTNVESLGNNCFNYCFSLNNINLPNTLNSIGNTCFSYCHNLDSVNIPNNTTSLGVSCFQDTQGLVKIEIGSGVTTIDKQWIRNCRTLRELKFKSTTPPTITADSNNYSNVPTTCKIYVPTGTLSAYTSASNYPSSSTYTYIEY